MSRRKIGHRIDLEENSYSNFVIIPAKKLIEKLRKFLRITWLVLTASDL